MDRRRRLASLGAVSLYLLCALLLGFKEPGLHYDEAVLQHGAVQMLTSSGEPYFAHDRGSWIRFGGRYWPLMVLPYVGSVKAYLLLLPFALFGPSPGVSRLVAALLGAFGIWGIARLLEEQISVGIAASVALALALHPAYLVHTVYDWGAVALWMSTVGILSVTLIRYLQKRTACSAFWVGAAMGVAVWGRANFLWFLASAFLAWAVTLGKKILIPARQFAALIIGGCIGGAPLLLYEILSDWATFRFIKEGQIGGCFSDLLARRFYMLSETLLSDWELRAIWTGPPLPSWQRYFFSAILVFALLVCLFLKDNGSAKVLAWRRASALTFLFMTLIMFSSRLNITEHHLVVLVPIAAVVIVLAFHAVWARWEKAWVPALLIALVYTGSALYWNIAAARGIRETGGVWAWSNAIFSLNEYVQSHYPDRELKILDWGLQNNLFVLSNGKILSRELFWGATKERSGQGKTWDEEISGGGLYLTNSAG